MLVANELLSENLRWQLADLIFMSWFCRLGEKSVYFQGGDGGFIPVY